MAPPDGLKPPRDEIRELTADSRHRLLWVVNNCGIEWATLLTLTYGARFPRCGPCAHTHLANLLRAIKIEWPGLLYLWVMEFQEREAPHFHVLLNIFGHGLPSLRYRSGAGVKGQGPHGWRREHRWVSRRWQDCMEGFASTDGMKAGIRWEYLETVGGGAAYLAEYTAKLEQKRVPEATILPGRFWGHSQAVRVEHGVPFVDVPLEEYAAEAEGRIFSEHGSLYSVIHNGRNLLKKWEPLSERGRSWHRPYLHKTRPRQTPGPGFSEKTN